MQSYSLEYGCFVWTGAPSRYLEMFDKPQKQACRIAESSLTLHSLVPHRRNVAGLSFFSVGITFVDFHLNYLPVFCHHS